MNLFHRIGNWIYRFRHRCGYGVHSPTDFFLITSVIYEDLPYYAYKELERGNFPKNLPHYRTKVNRLLFRLANYYHPDLLVEVGTGNGSSGAYLKAARPSAEAFAVPKGHEDLESLCKEWKKCNRKVDFMHIGFTDNPNEVFETVYPLLSTQACVVVGGIHQANRKDWWKVLLADERIRIAFDLYDIGILLFEEGRFKQNYVVNFF